MSAGIRIAAFVAALTLAATTLGVMGWYGDAGVSFATGLQNDVQNTSDDLGGVQAQKDGANPTGPGFFSIAVNVLRLMGALISLTYKAYGIMVSWGVPAVIALSIQTMIDLAAGLTLLEIARGFNFWSP